MSRTQGVYHFPVFMLLALLFIGMPALELYLLYKLSITLGFVTALTIILCTGFLGAFLAKTQGIFIWQKIFRELRSGKPPQQSIFSGFLIFVASLLLITPGIVTDIIGFLLLVPYVRLLIWHTTRKEFEKRVKYSTFSSTSQQYEAEHRSSSQQNVDEDSHIIDVEYTTKRTE